MYEEPLIFLIVVVDRFQTKGATSIISKFERFSPFPIFFIFNGMLPDNC